PLAGCDDRQAIVAEHGTRRAGAPPVLSFPRGILALVEDVLRVRKRRNPPPVAQRGVPAGMIDVQMRAEHVVDALEADAEGEQLLAPSLLAGKVERWRVPLVLAGACIDEYRV